MGLSYAWSYVKITAVYDSVQSKNTQAMFFEVVQNVQGGIVDVKVLLEAFFKRDFH